MIPRSSGESMSNIIKTLSNNMFDDLINRVEYFKGDKDCGDLYLAHINNFVTTTPATFKGSFVVYHVNESQQESVSVDKYYKTIKKYLSPNIPLLLVGTDPISQEIEIVQ